MKTMSLSALLLSSVFAISTVSAGKLSDAYHGIIPDNLEISGAGNLSNWRAKISEEFTKRAEKAALVHDQLERFFAPYTRKGTHEVRIIANAVCDYMEKRVKEKTFQKAWFEGIKDNDFTKRDGAKEGRKIGEGMGEVRPYGVHAAYVRTVNGLSGKIETIQKKINNMPTVKDQWEKYISIHREEKRKFEESLVSLEALDAKNKLSLKSHQEKIEDEEKCLIHTQAEMETLSKILEKSKEAYERELAPLDEDLEVLKVKRSAKEEEIKQVTEEDAKKALLEELAGLQDAARTFPKAFHELDSKYEECDKQPEIDRLELKNQIDLRMKTIKLLKEEKQRIEQKDLDSQNQKSKTNENIKQWKQAIESLSEKVASFEDDLKTLQNELRVLLEEKQKNQDVADAHALIKYITFLNLYSAIPNDDFNENFEEVDNKASVLSDAVVPFLVDFLNQNLSRQEGEIVKQAVYSEVKKFSEIVENELSGYSLYNELYSILINNKTVQTSAYTDDKWASGTATTLNQKVKEILSTSNLIMTYNEREKNHYDYHTESTTVSQFYTENKKQLEELRVDHILKEAMNKWRSKVSVGEESLMQRLALDTTFFNPDFTIQTYPRILSFQDFQSAFEAKELEDLAQNAKEKNVWALGNFQIKWNFFEERPTCIAPIYRFLKQKIARQPKEGHIRFEARFANASVPEKNKMVREAFLKFISYQNMSYALRFDGKGNALPTTLKMMDPALKPYLKEEIPTQYRLDNVLAGKVFKWGKRVQEHGKSFIAAEGLEAHIFAPSLQ